MKVEEFKKESFTRGKVMMSGEYLILNGALSLSMPTQKGQSLKVFTQKSVDKNIVWSCFDETGSSWFYGRWDFNTLDLIETTDEAISLTVSKILKILKSLKKIDFLGYHESLMFRSEMEFPKDWGIGSSSTLIVNLSKIFDLDAFKFGKEIFKGSLYDVASGMMEKSLLYKNDETGPSWEEVAIADELKDKLYFVHLNQKSNTENAISFFQDNFQVDKEEIERISSISTEMTKVKDLKSFDELIFEHEKLISTTLNMKKVGEQHFPDFWGKTKSLGAWGGDFMLATSDKGIEETKKYFFEKGHQTVLTYSELILQ